MRSRRRNYSMRREKENWRGRDGREEEEKIKDLEKK